MPLHLLLFAFSFCLAIGVQAQRSLVLTAPKISKERSFVEGSRLAVDTYDAGHRFKGRLRIENDSTIVIGGTLLPLYKIRQIRDKGLKRRLPGLAWIGGGTVIGGAGLLVIADKEERQKNHPDVERGDSKVGGLMTGLGLGGILAGLSIALFGPQFEVDPHHRFVVR